MRVEIKKQNIKDIKTAVFYSGDYTGGELMFKYIPTKEGISINLENHKSSEVRYLGTNEILDNNDFAEYEFSYLVDKYKFNSNLLINHLDNSSRNIIGKNVSVSTVLENCLFPSTIVDKESSTFSYFGAATYHSNKFFSFDLDNGVYKIELYDDYLDSNYLDKFYEYDALVYSNLEISVDPAIIVYLGPDRNDKYNNSGWYYSGDNVHNIDYGGALTYKKLLDEINYRKVVNLYLPKDYQLDAEINISLEAWKDDIKNPNRNTHNTILRNDDYYRLISKIDPIQEKNFTNLKYDINSMSLVSNTEISPIKDCPILLRKAKMFGYDTGDSNIIKYPDWVNSIRYRSGDKVYFEGLVWESLTNNNIGNCPLLSSDWEEVDKLTNYYTTRLGVYFNEGDYTNIGTVKSPNNVIISDDTDIIEINVKENVGFELITDSISIFPPYNNSTDLPMIKDYNNLNGYNYEHYLSQDLGHIFIFTNNQIDLLKEIKYIYFNAVPKNYSVSFMVSVNLEDDVNNLSWSGWTDGNSPGMKVIVESIYGELREYSINSTNTTFTVSTQEKFKIELLSDNNLYKLEGLISNNSDTFLSSDQKTIDFIKVLPTSEDDTRSSLIYTLLIKCIPVTLSIIQFDKFTVEKSQQFIKLNSSGFVRFYVTNSKIDKFNKAEITINKTVVSITERNNKLNVGDCEITLTKDPEGIYTLNFSKIVSNIDIKLL